MQGAHDVKLPRILKQRYIVVECVSYITKAHSRETRCIKLTSRDNTQTCFQQRHLSSSSSSKNAFRNP